MEGYKFSNRWGPETHDTTEGAIITDPRELKNMSMIDAADAVIDQMNSGSHNWSPVSAVEHTVRYSSDPEYRNRYDTYTKQRTKAYVGWSKDSQGNYHMPNGSAYSRIKEQESNLKNFKAPDPTFMDKYRGYRAAGSPNIDQEAAQKQVTDGTTNAVTKGFTEAAKSSHKIMNDPSGAISYAADKGALPKWMGKFADMYKNNPTAFWGILAAGGIGIAGLVSLFIGGRKTQPIVINNNIGSNTGPMPSSTSYWRA